LGTLEGRAAASATPIIFLLFLIKATKFELAVAALARTVLGTLLVEIVTLRKLEIL
jgi:hypothetical protein